MWSTPAGHEVELGRLLDELDIELGLLLLEDDLLVEVDVLVEVEEGCSMEALLEDSLLNDEAALLDGMQPTTSNDVTTATSKIFFLIIKKLFDLF